MLIYLWWGFCFLFYLIFIDNGIYMTEQFVQTVSSINYNKGIFSLYFVGQDPLKMAQGVMAESDNELALKQTVHMPAAGFMYMVSMIKNMLEDSRMAAEFDKLIAAGLIQAAPADAQETAPAATAQAAPRKKK
ncbi:peptide chain release factor 1 [Aeromonas hydrophila]|uniref:peptide chain release factor 1 n=1 Tax=Aeromonas hydrophila TaxID=644 RepID=UPI001116258C|nr:peptide chain release factor 1 [Aeromonas hydrophila]TNH80846.1 peptide chain release factor 1 [Aeromonas hydrophila]TNI00488.1 peptide chain release factor 1 [Aeromonas hydrophila]TNJ00615.1 peptide chain release factor 1 [Aeromonas hydrophila]